MRTIIDLLDLILIRIMMLIDYDDSDDYGDDDCNDDRDGGSDPRRLFAESPKNPSRQEVYLGKSIIWY